MDRISKKHRSWNMSRIRGTNTVPEMRVRSALHLNGYRFRLHRADLPGRPDIVLPKHTTVIFVHGCFWHRHRCRFSYTPKTRIDYWQEKFDGTIARDKRNQRFLKQLGWRIVVIWECETNDVTALRDRLNRLLKI